MLVYLHRLRLNVRHSQISQNTHSAKRNTQELAIEDLSHQRRPRRKDQAHAKTESLVDQQRVESVYTTHDQRLEERQGKKKIGEWIGGCFSHLVLLVLSVFDSLVVTSNSLHKEGLLSFCSPSSSCR